MMTANFKVMIQLFLVSIRQIENRVNKVELEATCFVTVLLVARSINQDQ